VNVVDPILIVVINSGNDVFVGSVVVDVEGNDQNFADVDVSRSTECRAVAINEIAI
jgi:hypothetical protein